MSIHRLSPFCFFALLVIYSTIIHMKQSVKTNLIFLYALIGIFQVAFSQNGTYSKRYYKQQKVTFNRPNGAYTNALLVEDFGNGSYYTDRDHAAIVDGTYQIKFKKGCKVGGTGAAVIVSTPKLTQYTMEYLIKYDENFESGLHGKQFGFNLGVGYSGGASDKAIQNGDGGSVRLQFDALDDCISNQLYVYYSDMTTEYGCNPGDQKYTMKRGVWNKIKLTVTMETSYEAKDARIEVWCNDEKKIDVTGLSLVRKDDHRLITGICFESFPGGGGIYPTHDNYLYLDDMTWYPGNDNEAFKSVPDELYMKGTALAESVSPLKMKRIVEGFPESYNGNLVTGNTYELITALKTGSYSFSVSESGEGLIQSQDITVENAEKNPVPYRIRVNFDNDIPQVTVEKITGAIVFAPFKKKVIANLDYIGNSVFEVRNIQYDASSWGDPRYRIRLCLEDGSVVTYGYLKGSISAPNDDSNASGYFELYPTTNIDDWHETIDGTRYTGNEFKLSFKRRGEGFDLAPFDMKVIFNSIGSYYHVISDYVEPPVGIIENQKGGIGIYPTFFNQYIMIEGTERGMLVEMYAIDGSKVLQTKTDAPVCKLENLNIPDGVYILKLSTRDNITETRRVIKY